MNDVPDTTGSSDDRPIDRLGLEAFDQVPVPDQWNDIVARSDDLEVTAPDSRRIGRWAMAAAVVSLVAGGAIAIILRNSDGATVQSPSTVDEVTLPTVQSPSTVDEVTLPTVESLPSTVTTSPAVAPITTVPPSTTIATTIPDEVATTVPAVITATTPAWFVACTEVAGDPNLSYRFDSRLADFTTLGGVPALELQLPVVKTVAGDLDPLVAVSQIPGGVLVLIQPPAAWPSETSNVESSMLVAVNTDGSIRWRRCIPEGAVRSLLVAPPDLAPTVAWIAVQGVEGALELRGFDLSTGADVAASVDGTGQTIRASTGRYAVIGKDWTGLVLEATDRLQVFDALDGSVDVRTYPPDASTRLGDLRIDAVVSETGDLVLIDYFPLSDAVRSVDTGEGWTNDLAAVRAAVPAQVIETFGEPYELRYVDGAGDVVWAVPDFHSVSREGFHTAIADSVVLAMRCVGWTIENQCGWVGETPPVEELVAYDKTTGAELWAGESGAVSIIARDVGVVATVSGYRQIDLTTGEPIAAAASFAEQWPSGAFANECCGGGDYTYAVRQGGIVVAVDGRVVRLWFPPELTGQTVVVPVAG